MSAHSGWEYRRNRGPVIPIGPFIDLEGEHDCGAVSPVDRWACTRERDHAGRHVACGTRVLAAWPGDHEPTEADLTASVPSGGAE